MTRILLYVIWIIQKAIFKASYIIHGLRFSKTQESSHWVVVGKETATMVHCISSALHGSVAVNLKSNKFYDFKYDYSLEGNHLLTKILSLVYFPYLLGHLIRTHSQFVYVGDAGFIIHHVDGRRWEFELHKSMMNKLVCYFVGSEIRSFKLMKELSDELDRDTICTYQEFTHPGFNSPAREHLRKKLATIADKYAHIIFNASVDQKSYISRQTKPFLYFVPEQVFCKNLSKFKSNKRIKIIHAPSSPIIKGTPLVRAAIKKLRLEGYEFDYQELINTPHSELLDCLKDAHIVLNEFYSFVPGVFGIEALANACALLTSADSNIEQGLFEGANSAWIVTPYWMIFDNLKHLLDNPSLIASQADRGYYWAHKYCSFRNSASMFNQYVDND